MSREKVEAEAKIIAEKLNDPDGLWFYFKAIRILGFHKCYELSSYTLEVAHKGKLRTTPAKYFNGCVLKEALNLGLKWNTNDNVRR